MKCSLCNRYEISTRSDGTQRIYKPEEVKGKIPTACICGSCTAKLVAEGYQEVPWEGKKSLEKALSKRIRLGRNTVKAIQINVNGKYKHKKFGIVRIIEIVDPGFKALTEKGKKVRVMAEDLNPLRLRL